MEICEKKIIIEKAKNGEETCKILVDDKWKYVYSKYRPRESIYLPSIAPETDCVVLGLGLGYELFSIREKTNGNIIVIDKNSFFLRHLSDKEPFRNLLKDPGIRFFIGEDYEKILPCHPDVHFIPTQIAQIELDYYSKIIQKLQKKNLSYRTKEKIIFLEHPTIADDCMDALRYLGYEVKKISFEGKKDLTLSLAKENPDYLFSINPSRDALFASKTMDVPYIFWTVDTPHYQLYFRKMIDNSVFAFVYDKAIVDEMKGKGYKNIFYMPVAANIRRLERIAATEDDIERFSSDLSFVGTSGIENEYNLYQFERHLNASLLKKIYSLFEEQKKERHKTLIKERVDSSLVEELEKQMGPLSAEDLLDKKDKLAFFLSRKYNELERIGWIRSLSQRYPCKVYGDAHWEKVHAKRLTYMGYAEHFVEMPKIFRISKINLNITRVFVESGLPMRIFDVLGSGGFLLSNNNADVESLFHPGKDLLAYRDLTDLEEIIPYYLNHEEERKEIAYNGCETVKKEHTYEKRLKKIMSIVKEKIKRRTS